MTLNDKAAFEKWADSYNHDSEKWEDMGRDEVFYAGYSAALADIKGELPSKDSLIKIAVIALYEDFNMLRNGDWEPDNHSIDASLYNLYRIANFLNIPLDQ